MKYLAIKDIAIQYHFILILCLHCSRYDIYSFSLSGLIIVIYCLTFFHLKLLQNTKSNNTSLLVIENGAPKDSAVDPCNVCVKRVGAS